MTSQKSVSKTPAQGEGKFQGEDEGNSEKPTSKTAKHEVSQSVCERYGTRQKEIHETGMLERQWVNRSI